jgi:leucyl aminopeptidase
MPSATPSAIACVRAPLSTIDSDLLVMPWFEAEAPGRFGELDRVTGLEISRALTSREFGGKPFETLITPVVDRSWKARRVAVVGAGREAAFDMNLARKLATAVALVARQRRIESLALVLRPGVADPSGDVDVAGYLQAIVEGLTLAEFDGASYKTGETALGASPRLTVVVPELPDSSPESLPRLEMSAARGRLLGDCSNLARQLANEPGNALTARICHARSHDRE